MKRILLLTTGGTIASSKSEKGLIPTLSSDEIKRYLHVFTQDAIITSEDILCLDSSNI